jgi:hypothetical protein
LKDKKREKARRKAAFLIGKLFETNGSADSNKIMYQVQVKDWAEIDSNSSESGDDENE